MKFVLPLLLVGSLLAPTTFSRSLQDQNEPQDPTQGEQDAETAGDDANEPQPETELELVERTLGVEFQREGTANLGAYATIQIPAGYVFGDREDATKFMQASHNFPSGKEVGLLAAESLSPWTIFEFQDIGFVDDKEKDDLDADSLIKGFREGNDQANEERTKRGWDTLEIVGWRLPPRYNPKSNNLEWAIEVKGSDGTKSVNHEVRLLGRKGVMQATLVCGAEEYPTLVADFDRALDGFSYVTGERYSEYTSGDKLAAYGLTALVAGGAGVIAAKTGLLAKFWKLIVAAVVAVGAGVKKLFGGKSKSDSATS